MRSPSAGDNTTTKKLSSSTPRSSSATCLCPPPSKSIEEVWKGITLSSLDHHSSASTTHGYHNHHHHHHHHDFPDLQDFLFRSSRKQPLALQPPPPQPPPRGGSLEPFPERCGGGDFVFGGLAPPPATVLSLGSSGSDQLCRLEKSDRNRPYPHVQLMQSHADGGADPFASSFEALSSPTDVLSTFCNKSVSHNHDNNNFSNFRHKRMIKNRESAARSRARKQAYANGLETEVERLKEENAKLRRLLLKFCSAASAEVPKRQTLHRTLTSPF